MDNCSNVFDQILKALFCCYVIFGTKIFFFRIFIVAYNITWQFYSKPGRIQPSWWSVIFIAPTRSEPSSMNELAICKLNRYQKIELKTSTLKWSLKHSLLEWSFCRHVDLIYWKTNFQPAMTIFRNRFRFVSGSFVFSQFTLVNIMMLFE